MKLKLSLIFAVLALLLGGTVALAASVEPVAVPNLEIGDAAFYCVTTLGYDFGLKIEAWGAKAPGEPWRQSFWEGVYDGRGSFVDEFVNEITIYDATRDIFSWESAPYAIDAVVVQGGWMDNIYTYDPAVMGDTELVPYTSNPNKREMISHVNFCWDKTDENGDDECYQEETAWAAGLPYIGANQWAMYVPYSSEGLTVDLLAGQNIDAGTVTFSAPADGWVTITVNLENGFVFYYDVADIEEDDNLKVQDYAVAPEGNPAIGLFDWKTMIPVGSTTGSIVVPLNSFYGVHLDVAYLIECPIE